MTAQKDGSKRIADIKVGDEVYSENPETGETGYQKVKEVFITKTDTILTIKTQNETIETTKPHPFYVIGKGFVAAKDLQVGDHLKMANGEEAVIESLTLTHHNDTVTVYNFEVENWHTYHVSGSEVLVHNVAGNACAGGGQTAKSSRRALAEQKLADAASGVNNKAIDPVTGLEIDELIIGDSRGNLIIAPKGGRFDLNRPNGVDIHSFYPNGSNYQRYNPIGHGSNSIPHGHGHLMGSGPGRRNQGASIDMSGKVVPFNSPDAHWSIH